MAQTTTALPAVNQKLEFSANGTDWTDISGSSNSLEPPEQSGQVGKAFTYAASTGIVTAGKTDPVEITVKILFTPTAGEAFAVVRTQWQTTGRAGYLRWSPQGGTTGHKQYTTTAGVLSGFTWPGGAADDANPIPAGFKLTAPSIAESTVA